MLYPRMQNRKPIGRRENMRRIPSKDSAPEMKVRRTLHALGYRYRLHVHKLPGRPDLVFPSRRKIILVHGCFWHGHENCTRSHKPRTNRAYRGPTNSTNQERDLKNRQKLESLGWSVAVVWECEVGREALAEELTAFLELPTPADKEH